VRPAAPAQSTPDALPRHAVRRLSNGSAISITVIEAPWATRAATSHPARAEYLPNSPGQTADARGSGRETDDRLADRDRSLAARRSAARFVGAGRRTRCREGDADDRKRYANCAAYTQVLAQHGHGENGRHSAICRTNRAHQAHTAAILESPVEREVAKQAEQPGTDQAQRHASAHARERRL
jgi:hypothetical protein